MNALCTAAKASAFVGLLLLAASPARAELDRPSAAHLAALSATPTQAGELIYRGATFAQNLAGPEPLFRYERRVNTMPTGFEATHLTRDPARQLVVVESAQFNAAYRLQRFAVQNQQLGHSGTVHVSTDGRRLRYSLNDRGVVSTAEESIDLPAGFIVMKEKQTYGFDIRQDSAANGQVVYSITASSWLIRPFVATMRATFDVGSKTWVRYEGRVPPMQTVAGKLTTLDARVDYTAVAVPYR